MKSRFAGLLVCLFVWFGFPAPAIAQSSATTPTIRLTSSIQLARLVDLAAQQNAVEVEYAPNTLGNKSVTLRLVHELTPLELWDLCLSVLHSNDLTIIRRPGREGLYAVVSLQEAAKEVLPTHTFETTPLAPGYVAVIVPLQTTEPAAMVEALKPMLGTGNKLSVTPAPAWSGVLLSGIRERVLYAIEQVRSIDEHRPPPVVTSVPVRYRAAVEVVAETNALLTSLANKGAPRMTSDITPDAVNQAVRIIGPASEEPAIRTMIERVDRPALIETRSFDPRGYPPETVASFLESVARDPSPRGSGEGWRLVQDALTNTLILTATPAELEAAEQALDRLATMPMDARRVIRMIPVRHREASKIREIAGQLLNASLLGTESGTQISAEPAEGLSPSPRSTAAPSTSDLDLAVDREMNTIIATGTPMRIAQLEGLIRDLDVRQPQVQLEIIMLSLSESESRDFGVELAGNIDTGETLVGLGSLFGLSSVSPSSTSAQASGTGGSAVVLSPGDFSAVVRAIETLNDGRSASMPSIVVNNNETATLNSTTTQPFTTTTLTDGGNVTTSRGGSASAGTTITVSPQIAAGDHIVLDYAVSLSSFVGESSSDGVEPPTQQTSLNSIATIPDGYTIALGGIEITSEGDSDTKTPGLSEIPLLGELFKSKSDSSSRSRFYVFIRPTVMRSPSFEHLKYLSEELAREAQIDDGWPTVQPRVIE